MNVSLIIINISQFTHYFDVIICDGDTWKAVLKKKRKKNGIFYPLLGIVTLIG